MHYRNGRAAKNGDEIVQLGTADAKVRSAGTLIGATAVNGDFCNGSIVSFSGSTATVTGACLCDCLHVDDVAAILAEKALDKRPPGK